MTSFKGIYFLVSTQRYFVNFFHLQVDQVAVRSALLFHSLEFLKYKKKKEHCFVDEFLQISQ